MQTVFIVAMLITIVSIPLNIAIDLAIDIMRADVKQATLQSKVANISSSISNIIDKEEQKRIIYEQLLVDIKYHRIQLRKCRDFQYLILFDTNWKYVYIC